MLNKLINYHSTSVDHHVVSLFTPPDTPLTVEPDNCLSLSSPLNVPRALLELRSIIRDKAPDLILSWMYHSCLLAAVAAPKGLKLVWNIRHSLHDLAHEKATTRQVIRACALLSKRPEATIYCAQTAVSQHADLGFNDRQPVSIPNGFDTKLFHPLDQAVRGKIRRKLGVPDGAFLIGNAARFHPMKNHDGLLQAFARVAVRHSNIHLVLAGYRIGPNNTELSSEVERLGIQNRVTIAELQRDMPSFLGTLDLYISASRWGEGFPNVIGEAMACGTPVLTTDVGDSARIVGSCGFLSATSEAVDISDALMRILNVASAHWEETRKLSRARIIQEFSIDRITNQYEKLFTDLARS